MRVGKHESKVSTPRAAPAQMEGSSAMPKRWFGLSMGRLFLVVCVGVGVGVCWLVGWWAEAKGGRDISNPLNYTNSHMPPRPKSTHPKTNPNTTPKKSKTHCGMVKRSTSFSSSRSLPSAPPTAKPSKGSAVRYSALALRRALSLDYHVIRWAWGWGSLVDFGRGRLRID